MIGVLITKLIAHMNNNLELFMVIINSILRSCFGKIRQQKYIMKTCKFLLQKSTRSNIKSTF